VRESHPERVESRVDGNRFDQRERVDLATRPGDPFGPHRAISWTAGMPISSVPRMFPLGRNQGNGPHGSKPFYRDTPLPARMLLATTWFGTFLLDEGAVRGSRLFPKDPSALADRLALVEDWKVLDEERELMASLDEVFVTEPRLERAGGTLTKTRPPFLDPEAFGFDRGLLHAAMLDLAKRKMRKAIRAEDHLGQAVAAVDDLQEQENLLVERLREWYGLHFPELARMVDEQSYLQLVALHGRRDSMPIEHRDSIGADLGSHEETQIRAVARLAQEVSARRGELERYVERTVVALAPNVVDLSGPMIAARLVTLAGGLQELARAPSGTIQVLGAERSLFLHIRTGSRPPKHGVLFQHPLVHRAPAWQRGAIARAFAGKIAIAARADAFTKRSISEGLKRDLAKTLENIARKKEKRPTRSRPKVVPRRRASRGQKRF